MSDAHDLWENWERATPFTAGPDGFVNIGETHDVAFAIHHFGPDRIPDKFDWEDHARHVEHAYVRGWAAKDGSQMFLWDDFRGEILVDIRKFEQLLNVILALASCGHAARHTELWEEGGYQFIGTLGHLALWSQKAERRRTHAAC